MDEPSGILSGLLLFNDGVGVICAFLMAEFYERRKGQEAIRTLFWFFRILWICFLLLALSDICREVGFDAGFFTSSLGRGMIFRGPLTFVLLWGVHRNYGAASGHKPTP